MPLVGAAVLVFTVALTDKIDLVDLIARGYGSLAYVLRVRRLNIL